MRRRDNITRPAGEASTVVDAVARQAAQAAALADIAGQDRLLDPSTNPAVRPYGDQLRNTEQREQLDAGYAQRSRQRRVADKRSDNAEKTLDVVRAAKQMASPARSVMALHKGRTRFLGLAMIASVGLAIGSATGPADLAADHIHHAYVGWIAEVAGTGLSTMAIMYRSHLGEHGAGSQLKKPDGKMTLHAWVLMALAIVPLLASVVANAISHGPIGVLCSLGAAAFGVFAHVISGQSSTAMQAKAGQVTGEDEAELHAIAIGAEPAAPAHQAAEPVEDTPAAEREAEVSELFSNDALWAWMNEPPEDEDGRPDETPPGDDDTDGVAKPLPYGQEPQVAGSGDTETGRSHLGETTGETTGSHEGETRSHFRPKPEMRPGLTSGASRKTAPRRSRVSEQPPRVLANAANTARGDETAQRIRDYETAHPDATVKQICTDLGVSKATVMRARKKLKQQKG